MVWNAIRGCTTEVSGTKCRLVVCLARLVHWVWLVVVLRRP